MPVHRNADCLHEPKGNSLGTLQHNKSDHLQHNTCLVAVTPFAMDELDMAGASCAQTVVPTFQAVLETTAGYKAAPPSLQMHPFAASLSEHTAALLPSSVMCQPVTVMTQPLLTWTKPGWPDPAAVLQATAQSSIWQKHQHHQQHHKFLLLQLPHSAQSLHHGQQCPVLAMQASPSDMKRSSDWLQLHHQQLQQQEGAEVASCRLANGKVEQVM